jgi:flagellar biosynthesis/type III secretory pathway M-ring protein FliF/YscJ
LLLFLLSAGIIIIIINAFCNPKATSIRFVISFSIANMSEPKVTICDSNGKIMHSDHRKGVQNLLSPEESKKSLELAVNSWKTRSQLAQKIEKENMYWQNMKSLNASPCH